MAFTQASSAERTVFQFDRFELDPARMTLLENGETVHIEPQVLRLISLLVEHHDRIVPRDEINAVVWEGRQVSEASLTTRLRSARTIIGDNGSEQRLIKTIPNVGLRFVGDVSVKTVRAPSPAPVREWVMKHTVLLIAVVIATAAIGSGGWYWQKTSDERALSAQFARTEDAAISGYNNSRMFYASRYDCMRACLSATDFVCRSFDYYNTENACDLSEETAESIGGLKTDYELPQSYDHYARIMPTE
ncbi:winged helix-turn-helix domain-containing protein [Ponticaulis sp.]|uniref:winged helix-turn-helix domain-containing protein n=1 Tax=Ponticaulis sp. TaxID=2020902 RepID=UPI0025E861CC|nr:winged helix-turn-helix domain-containing protein [Ponticaulis sp.]